jgi:dTDP-4-dehydrorhamnose reductase
LRTVVVGASGFLGGAIVDHWRASGRPVVGVGRRLAGRVDVETTLDRLSALLATGDSVINAAGVAIKDAPGPTELISENLRIAAAVGQACAERGVRLLHISSADVWPITARSGAEEDAPVVPDTAYGLSKLIAELALSELRRSGTLDYAVLRPTYVVGPGMFEGAAVPCRPPAAGSGSADTTQG